MSWTTLTRRTENPKLDYLEKLLAVSGIESRRNGHSAHAPIMQVKDTDLAAAWDLLTPIDDIDDDDPRWNDDPPGMSEWEEHRGPWEPAQ